MQLSKELEDYINKYLEFIKDTSYAKKILFAGSRDVIKNLKKHFGESLTVKMLPMSIDKEEAPNLFINLQNLLKESEKIIKDTFSRNIINDKNLVFAFKIKTIPETDILDYLKVYKEVIFYSGQKIYIIDPITKKINSDVDYSYILLFNLISSLLQKIRNIEKSKEPTEFDWEKAEVILKSFTIYAYSGSSSTDVYEIELSDIYWLYKNYFKKDRNPFDFIDKVLEFFKDPKKDRIIITLLNKFTYIFLNYRKVDEILLDLLYNELFKRAKEGDYKNIPKPYLIMMNQELEKIYIKGYSIGKAFASEEKQIEYIEKIVLALKSERDPNSFREKLLNYLITGKTTDKHIILPEELFKKDISRKEFLALKNAFLAGLWNGSHSKSDNESDTN